MRLASNQPQMHFSKSQPIIVKPDRNIAGKQIENGYEYRQGKDYMIIPGLQDVVSLVRMGYEVKIKE